MCRKYTKVKLKNKGSYNLPFSRRHLSTQGIKCYVFFVFMVLQKLDRVVPLMKIKPSCPFFASLQNPFFLFSSKITLLKSQPPLNWPGPLDRSGSNSPLWTRYTKSYYHCFHYLLCCIKSGTGHHINP